MKIAELFLQGKMTYICPIEFNGIWSLLLNWKDGSTIWEIIIPHDARFPKESFISLENNELNISRYFRNSDEFNEWLNSDQYKIDQRMKQNVVFPGIWTKVQGD